MKKTIFYTSVLLMIICTCAIGSTTHAPYQKPFISKDILLHKVLKQMAFIQGGSYTMGTNDKKYIDFTGDNAYPHPVTLNSFYIQRYLTSGTLYNSYLKTQGEDIALEKAFHHFFINHAAARVNWSSANRYCQWLSDETDLPFSLPTEAQWEYAARSGGQDIPYPTDSGKLKAGENYPDDKTFLKSINGKPFLFNDVRIFPVNQIGIHQMGGNTCEWVSDWYTKSYYWLSPINNPKGPDSYTGEFNFGGPLKVTRGMDNSSYQPKGDWRREASTYARDFAPAENALVGFRCVINSDAPLPKSGREHHM